MRALWLNDLDLGDIPLQGRRRETSFKLHTFIGIIVTLSISTALKLVNIQEYWKGVKSIAATNVTIIFFN